MDKKRIITTVVGLPLVILVFIFSNKYIIDALMAVIATIAMHEYINCVRAKDIKVIKWISYLMTLSIAFIHVIPSEAFAYSYYGFPIIMLILFLHVIFTNMKISLEDIVYTLFGIIYVVGTIAFFAAMYAHGGSSVAGKLFIWFIISTAWGTDIFAYIVGRHFGKTKISQISPKKSLEGCVGGIIAAVVISVILAVVMNTYLGQNISLLAIGIMAMILSIIGQLGDFSASVIKRSFGVKDYSNLFPGHGGMLDRIDSVMFITPFAFMFLNLFF